MELERIGWACTRPLMLTSAEGEEVDMIATTWRDVRKLLVQGVAHQLGRELVQMEWPG